jgi:hypothetical protein
VTYPLSLFARFSRAVDTGTAETLLHIDAGSANDRFVIRLDGSDLVEGNVNTGGVNQAAVSVAGAVSVGVSTKAAGRCATNDARVAKSGTLSSADTLVTAPATPTDLRFGHRSAGEPLFGYLEIAAAFNSAVNDAGLTAMTT